MEIRVIVRWLDGYMESFRCSEVRCSGELLSVRLMDEGSPVPRNRQIPLSGVRWYTQRPESHEEDLG